MAKTSKPKLLKSAGKSVPFGASASSSKSPLMALAAGGAPGKKDYSKSQPPQQTFAIPGFGDTGMTGES